MLASKTTFLAILMFLDWNDFKLFAPLVIILRTLWFIVRIVILCIVCFSYSSCHAIVGSVSLNVFMVQHTLILFFYHAAFYL